MKKWLLPLIFISLFLTAETGEIVYLEGTVDIRVSGGSMEPAEIGMTFSDGDTLITGIDGFCEISLQGESSMIIDKDTVFSFQRASLSPEKEPESVFRVAIGKISFKFTSLFGREPAITTPATVCGIRGTEFTVVASADGQSLYVVSEGEVAVESSGELVSLLADEAVQASTSGLGEKYPVLSGNIDFEGWLAEADQRIQGDPTGTLETLIPLIEEYVSQADTYKGLFLEEKERNQQYQEEIKRLLDQGKQEEAEQFDSEYYVPSLQAVKDLVVNYRYYALSAQSLRRYVISELYVQYRIALLSSTIKADASFESLYEKFNSIYEERAVSYFVDMDI